MTYGTCKIEIPDARPHAAEGAGTGHVTRRRKKSPEAFPLGAQ